MTQTNHQIGVTAETKCCEFLRDGGYKILAERYKTKFGEIDIVARDKQTLLFVEVKRRKAGLIDDPITATQKKRIANAALHYISEHPEITELDMRFDCIFVDSEFSLNHIKDAWRIEA